MHFVVGISHNRMLLTSCPPSNEPEVEQLNTRLQEQKVPVFTTGIPRLKAFVKASTEGVMVSEVKDSIAARGWEAYVEVGKEAVRDANSHKKAH